MILQKNPFVNWYNCPKFHGNEYFSGANSSIYIVVIHIPAANEVRTLFTDTHSENNNLCYLLIRNKYINM